MATARQRRGQRKRAENVGGKIPKKAWEALRNMKPEGPRWPTVANPPRQASRVTPQEMADALHKLADQIARGEQIVDSFDFTLDHRMMQTDITMSVRNASGPRFEVDWNGRLVVPEPKPRTATQAARDPDRYTTVNIDPIPQTALDYQKIEAMMLAQKMQDRIDREIMKGFTYGEFYGTGRILGTEAIKTPPKPEAKPARKPTQPQTRVLDIDD